MNAFSADVAGLAARLERSERRRITRTMAEEGQAIFEREARRDAGGDLALSGWKGRALDTLVKPVRDDMHLLVPTRKGAGPITTLDRGRNQGNATGRGGVAVFSGPLVDRRQGTSLTLPSATGRQRKLRRSQVKRWSGYTSGRNTAGRANARMEREIPVVAERELMRVIAERFDID